MRLRSEWRFSEEYRRVVRLSRNPRSFFGRYGSGCVFVLNGASLRSTEGSCIYRGIRGASDVMARGMRLRSEWRFSEEYRRVMRLSRNPRSFFGRYGSWDASLF
jgi:preprotein translocase subunit Sss1